ncbi:Lrp/AsnC family transcriptional regulator [Ruoffia sp. FAM 24228]|uniref:Lrp/AsnC family transcriptional regulator n=1 Tax=unclassified Ruoffia TaxID=2862149 RepID=UPI000EEC8A8F|nr:AsnC family transcriptional regulator [Aerococcaceae bacterium]
MNQRENILKLIEQDSRLKTSEIATMLDIEESVVEQIIIELEEEKVIIGYHTLINWDKTEDEYVSAMIEVKVNPQRGQGFDRIASLIYDFPEIEAMYLMSGGYDFSIELKKAPMREIARFVTRKLSVIDEVQSTATHVILKKYKDHGTLFDNDDHDRRMGIFL